MNKKVMALAVAGVLAAPAAFAQSSNVQLYGRANLGFDNYRATGASNQGPATGIVTGGPALAGSTVDFKSRNRIFDTASRVGLRGTEDLGNGLKAIFQIETGVNVDSGNNVGQNGTVSPNFGFWAARDSFVGLDSNWGRTTFGRQSIYWANGVNAQFSANYINTEIPWTNGASMGRMSRNATNTAFTVIARQSNVVAYTTPTFYGLNATVSYSPNEQEAIQGNLAGGAKPDGRTWGVTTRGEWGPWYAQVDWAQRRGATPIDTVPPAVTFRTDYNTWKAGASWAYLPGARVGLIYVRARSNNILGLAPGDTANQSAWTANWEHTFGNLQALAQYGMMGDIKDCDAQTPATVSCSNTKARAWMVGTRYFLSKRTWLYASYNEVRNKGNQFADYVGGNYTAVNLGATPVPYGADPRVFALGLFHAF